MKNLARFLIVALVLVVLGLLYFKREPVVKEIVKVDTVLVRDTIHIIAPAKVRYKKVYIERVVEAKPVVVVETDSSAWIATLDTAVGKANIKTAFYYPQKRFEISLAFEPDTIQKVVTIERPVWKYEAKQAKWYEDVAKYTIGFALGFLAGRAK